MIVKFKKLNRIAITPKKAYRGDAGFDLTAVSSEDLPNGKIRYGTGIAVEIPEGYVGLVFPRSSIFRFGLMLSNAVGVIDSGIQGRNHGGIPSDLRRICLSSRGQDRTTGNHADTGNRIAGDGQTFRKQARHGRLRFFRSLTKQVL